MKYTRNADVKYPPHLAGSWPTSAEFNANKCIRRERRIGDAVWEPVLELEIWSSALSGVFEKRPTAAICPLASENRDRANTIKQRNRTLRNSHLKSRVQPQGPTVSWVLVKAIYLAINATVTKVNHCRLGVSSAEERPRKNKRDVGSDSISRARNDHPPTAMKFSFGDS